MQPHKTTYDVAIIGGGLAGLSTAILCATAGFKVVLIEKERYPFHKVCGEYISMESYGFLQGLGVPLPEMQLPLINSLQLTSPSGNSFNTKLPLGGVGISRYKLDEMLAGIAKARGVEVVEECKATNVSRLGERFQIEASSNTIVRLIEASVVTCAYGKRSNLDVKWQRDFISKIKPGLNNYVGIKYHVKTNWPAHLIGLHNFQNGYCGISKIEDEKFCLCYLTRASNLKAHGNSIQQMQEQVLFKNPFLKKIFSESEFLFQTPITISQISFSNKKLVEDGLLMLGDAAGMITPLCGNGMSIALHSGKIAATVIKTFLKGESTRRQMEDAYREQWNTGFKKRLQTGRLLQRFFGMPLLSNLFVSACKTLPFLSQAIIKKTHGKPF